MQDDETRKRYWENMIEGMDVLVTHGPPMGIRGKIEDGTEIGCQYLREFVDRVKPKYHFFGHNHAGAGIQNGDGTMFVNAAILTEDYKMAREPVIIDI